MEAIDRPPHSRRVLLITVVQVIFALPALTLVLIGCLGEIEYTYGTFYIARIVILVLFLFSAFAFLWFSRSIKGRSKKLDAIVFALHCLAFAVLAHWFGGVHRP